MSSSSPTFKAAADYLSNASHLSKVSNNVKLELYALYKCITVSKRPATSRPSLFDFAGRAKWDAWNELGSKSDSEEDWINRYLEIARSLGWKEGSAESHGSDPLENTVESEVNKKNEGGGVGIGRHVSIVSAPDIPVEDTLHGRVLENDVNRVIALLDENPSTNVNAKDEYGYTPLHLAADRGHTEIVSILLEKGADTSIKDADDYTAFELADLAGHREIKDMLL